MTDPFQDDTLLARWLAGTLTEAEEARLRAHPDFPAFERLARGSEKLRPPTYDLEAGYAKLREQTASSRPTRHLRPRKKRWLRYAIPAAAVLLLLLAIPLLWSNDMTTVVAEAATPRSVQLDDGTDIRLHAGSVLDYRLSRNERQTKLRGEAYFKVARDEDRPFEVITDLGKVTVLGTSFNVTARANVLRVTCSEGRVRVTPFGQDMAYLVTAGTEVELGPAGVASVETVDTTLALDWLADTSRFDGVQLREVVREVEEQYGIDIQVDKQIDLDQRITTSFAHDEPVADVLQTIFGALPDVVIEVEGEVATIRKRR
jgi:ferric-dicitrate binding protein FerR (iron transport regulator)